MLELERYSLWLPATGVVLDDVTIGLAAGRLYGVVGRTGAGASALLRAIAGRLAPGAHRRGTLRTGSRHILYLADLPPVGVADYLGGLGALHASAPATSPLTNYLGHRTTSVPPDIRASLLLATLITAPRSPIVLVDAVLTAAAPAVRERFARELRSRADDGALVLVADHDLDTLWGMADHFLELDHGRIVQSSPANTWHPRTLPEPTLLTLARLLGIDVVHSHSVEGMREHIHNLPSLPASATRAVLRRASSTIIPADDVGLTGAPLEFGATECVGLLNLARRVETDARRIITRLAGDVVSSHPARRDLGTAAFARRRVALAESSTTPLWLPHIQAGLDPRERHDLATALAGDNAGVRLVTGRDVEFLVRACHRIIVLDGDEVLTSGSPYAVAEYLPSPPLVSRATGSTRLLRLGDLAGKVATT